MPNLVKILLISTLLSSGFYPTAFAGQREANLEISRDGKITLSGNPELPPPKELEDGSVILPEAKDFPSTVYFTLKKDTVLDCVAGYWTIRHPSLRVLQKYDEHSFMLVEVKGVEKGKLNVLRIEDQMAIGYYFGVGITRRKMIKNEADHDEAFKWFHRAANFGQKEAQYFLADAYAHGRGTDKDETLAVKWYAKSAEQGMTAAQVMLGFSYLLGKGVPKDEVEAYAYFNIAGANDEDARKYVAKLEGEMSQAARLAAQQRSRQLLQEFEAKRDSLRQLLEEAKKNREKKGA